MDTNSLVNEMCLFLGLYRPGWSPNPRLNIRYNKRKTAWYGNRLVYIH